MQVSDYPRLVVAGEDGFSVTTGGIGEGDEVVEKYSYTGQKLGWSFRLPGKGAAWGITFADGSLKKSVPLPGGNDAVGEVGAKVLGGFSEG